MIKLNCTKFRITIYLLIDIKLIIVCHSICFENLTSAILNHLFNIIFAESLVFLNKFTLLNNKRIPSQFYRLSFNNFFFNRIFRNQSININYFFLPNSMSSIHCLKIHLRVIIAIINHNSVSGHQINSQSTSSC